MKKHFLIALATLISVSALAHEHPVGNDHNRYTKPRVNRCEADKKHKTKTYERINYGYGENIPAKVTESFHREFPFAKNPVWSKSRGNWVVRFADAGNNRRSAVYHANGTRVSGGATGTKTAKPDPGNYGGLAPAKTSRPDPAKYGGIKTTPSTKKPDPRNYGGVAPATNGTKPDPANYGGMRKPDSTKPDPKKYGGM
jgi:hypothetical protein